MFVNISLYIENIKTIIKTLVDTCSNVFQWKISILGFDIYFIQIIGVSLLVLLVAFLIKKVTPFA